MISPLIIHPFGRNDFSFQPILVSLVYCIVTICLELTHDLSRTKIWYDLADWAIV